MSADRGSPMAPASPATGRMATARVVLAGPGREDAHDTQPEAEPWLALQARRRRWAELLRRVFKVEVEVCPRCGGAMRIVGFVTEHAVIARILAHLERRGVEARAGPWAAAGQTRRAAPLRRELPPGRVETPA